MSEPKGRLQFSLSALLSTVAAVAVLLALMFQVPIDVAAKTLVLLQMVATAFVVTCLAFGRSPTLQAFCVGALVPLGVMTAWLTMNLSALTAWFGYERMRYQEAYFSSFGNDGFARLYGVGIILSIALGYLCVGFRWFIERERP
ncbi:MAG TPA: hypothetical protein VG826_05715 [Pirellulales bacterium]|nr:hypothetical protein [Pirellulales bacterium]